MAKLSWMYLVCDHYVPPLVDFFANYFCNHCLPVFACIVSQTVSQLG